MERWIHEQWVKLLNGPLAQGRSTSRIQLAQSLHTMFFGVAKDYPEVWGIRRDFYLKAAEVLWRLAATQPESVPTQTMAPLLKGLITMQSSGSVAWDSWKKGICCMVCLLGLAEVEVAEIMGISETSVQRSMDLWVPALEGTKA